MFYAFLKTLGFCICECSQKTGHTRHILPYRNETLEDSSSYAIKSQGISQKTSGIPWKSQANLERCVIQFSFKACENYLLKFQGILDFLWDPQGFNYVIGDVYQSFVSTWQNMSRVTSLF